VVVGATGNVGTSVLRALAADDAVDEIVGVARRAPGLPVPKTTWVAADIERSDLATTFGGADCVVHLAWRIQPSHDMAVLRGTNITGTARVFRAVADAGVPALVYASSVGAYSAGPQDRRVDESWPTGGTPSSFYARHKAEAERLLDRFEAEHAAVRVVRLRPALTFKRTSGEEQRRYFLGRLFPRLLARRGAIAVVPDLDGLRFQAVHTDDVADAYRRAVIDSGISGAFNVAAEPVLDADLIAKAFSARKVPIPPAVARRTRSKLATPAPADTSGMARHGIVRAADGHDARQNRARLGAAAFLDGGSPRAPDRDPGTRERTDACFEWTVVAMFGRWRRRNLRSRAARQQGDPTALEREGDPRGGLQNDDYRRSDPRDLVTSEGVTMSGPGGAPQEDTTPDERRRRDR